MSLWTEEEFGAALIQSAKDLDWPTPEARERARAALREAETISMRVVRREEDRKSGRYAIVKRA